MLISAVGYSSTYPSSVLDSSSSCPYKKIFPFFTSLFLFLNPELFTLTNCSPRCCFFQNILRGCSVLLGPGTSGLWRALAQSQNHIPGGGPAELTELLEQYAQNLARNMKLTYLNPVALVAPNLGEFRKTTHTLTHSDTIQ